jgi:ABC-2 type transport system permease protein
LLVPLSGVLLWNRLIWLSVGAIILVFAYSRFSFTHVAGRVARKTIAEEPEGKTVTATSAVPTRTTFDFANSFREMLSLTRLQFSETVRNVFFAVLVLAGALLDVITAVGINNPFSTPVYPVTWRMLELGGGGFSLFILAIVTFYSGELVWRERDANINQIMDALPVRRWVLFGSKLLALMLAQVLLLATVLICGLLVQAAQGYHHYELGLYLTDLFLRRLISFWILCVVAMLVHTIVNHKYLGHFVMVLYFIATIAVPQMNFQDYLYRIGILPTVVYSDMNGYGPYVAPTIWFGLYWGIGAVLMAICTNLLWVRGTDANLVSRLRLVRARLTPLSKTALGVGTLLFISVGAYIYYNTHVLNRYLTNFTIQQARAQYEIKYKQFQTLSQPKLTGVQVEVELHPEQRLAILRGKEWVENRSGAPIDRIALSLWPEDVEPIPRPIIKIQKLTLEGGQNAIIEDPTFGFFLYRLRQPLLPDGRIAVDFDLEYPNPGFVNSTPNGDIVRNGSFLNSSYLPFIGYLQDVELVDDSARRRHGLQKSAGLPKLENSAARQNNYVATQADWVNFEGTVSTSPDQIAIMPGYLQKEWTENGRRYFHYKADTPIMAGIFSVNSARYAVRRGAWHDVNLEIYYHPGHEFDLDKMMLGMQATLDYCTSAFSPFQFRQVRIIEFPRYATFAESFPNTIPFSENIGFITYVDPQKKDAINLPFFVTAHEVAHQWWGHQVVSANTEGATAIVETLAQYSALMVMKHTYGDDSMKKFLRRQLDGYLRGRAQERNEEKTLLRVEPGQGYIHYNKGGQVMYALQDYIGEERVSQALAALTKDYGLKGPPFPTSLELETYLRRVTPPEFQYLYEDWFENITLFDNRAVSATARKTADGKYQVTIAVEAKKYRADGKGEEHTIPLHDLIDVGVLDAQGNFLYLQKQKIQQEHQEFVLTVDKEPAQAGVDPLIKLIDRNPDDNLIAIKNK